MSLIDTLSMRRAIPSREAAVEFLESVKVQIDERIKQLQLEIHAAEQQKIDNEKEEAEIVESQKAEIQTEGVEDVETTDSTGEAGPVSEGNPQEPAPV
jgi:hypothetical protein